MRNITADPQLGILSLAAVLEERGDHVQIVDLDRSYLRIFSNGRDFAEGAAEEIAATEAQVYGFSSICSSYPSTLRIARALKVIRPDSIILLGGPQATVVDIPTLEAFPFVDMVLRGEAEQTLPALLDQLQGMSDLEQVPGLTYRTGSRIRRTGNAPLIKDLDELPLPAYHLTELLPGTKVISLELGRGCPFACTFCSTNDFFRRNFRLHSPQRMLDHMRQMTARYGIRKFQFVHDMFTVDRKRVVEFCHAMLGSGEDFLWSCSARTDCVDEPLLELMFRAGCRSVFFGVEVGSDKMQKIIDKGLDLRQSKDVIDATERIGISTTVSLITGFPEETWDDVRQTMDIFLHSLGCASAFPQLNVLAPLAETPLYSKYQHQLVLDELCSVMSHQGLDQHEADLQLIRNYPVIFPNFYLLPMPHMDRSAILELREFSLAISVRLRWISVALHQSSSDTLDLFLKWRDRRMQMFPDLHGHSLRHYYRTSQFGQDYLAFLRTQPAGKPKVVQALLDYHEVVAKSLAANELVHPAGFAVPEGALRYWTDVPVRKNGVVVVEISFDLQHIIDGLKRRTEPVWVQGRQFYAVRNADDMGEEKGRADKVSDWMALLLQACDGRRDVGDVVHHLSAKLLEIDEPLREYAGLRLLEGAQAEGLIEIYRNQSPEIETPPELTETRV
ncbi:MAG TPA: radical SAM protein [Candidatus Angelobacter sp.]|nr:radical SAM protein [Candidatus Angelobacter sp.]